MAAASNPSPPGTPSLRLRTMRGVMWIAAQAVATRGSTALQQLALGWLLSPDDFGLIGLTYTVTMFVNLLANPGIDTILIKRQRRFHLWATPAFWMGIAAGGLAMLTMLAVAPFVSQFYRRPQLTGLISVLALGVLFQSLQIVPKALLQSQMRFRAIALVGTMNNVLLAVLTVAAASIGLGAYSFVVPVPFVGAVVAAAYWWLARPPVKLQPEFRRWCYLLGTSVTLLATQLLFVFDNQVDYVSLGVSRLSDAAIGTYVFAFSVAVQSLRLLSSSIMVVLFPSLNHLAHDPGRQTRAALRALRLLALVSIPFCLLQILLTPAAFRLLLPDKWNAAVWPCQILTFGLMINAACWPAASLFNAQGRFRVQFWVSLATSALLAASLALALWYRRDIVAVAMAVAIWNCITTGVFHTAAFWKRAPSWSLFRELGPPLIAGLAAAVACMLFPWYLPKSWIGDLVTLGAGSTVFVVVYLLLIRTIAPASLDDLIQQLLPLWHRIRGTQTVEEAAREAVVDEAAIEVLTTADGAVTPADLSLPIHTGESKELG